MKSTFRNMDKTFRNINSAAPRHEVDLLKHGEDFSKDGGVAPQHEVDFSKDSGDFLKRGEAIWEDGGVRSAVWCRLFQT
jgi:hypothetical protein